MILHHTENNIKFMKSFNLEKRRKYNEITRIMKYFRYFKMSDPRPLDKSGKNFKTRNYVPTELKSAAFRGG